MKTVTLNNIKALVMVREACINEHGVVPKITAKIIGGKPIYTVSVTR